MAKRDYTTTKLALTGAIAGITMLTAGWLAQPQGNADDGLTLADEDGADAVASYSTATPPTTSSGGSQPTSTTAPAATATQSTAATKAAATTSTTAKTTRAS